MEKRLSELHIYRSYLEDKPLNNHYNHDEDAFWRIEAIESGPKTLKGTNVRVFTVRWKEFKNTSKVTEKELRESVPDLLDQYLQKVQKKKQKKK